MGNCETKDPVAESISRKIDQEIKYEMAAETKRQRVKILLLGPGESGKSTVLKQMRIIHCDGFSDHELRLRRAAVYCNLVECMDMLVSGVNQLGVTLLPERRTDAELVHTVYTKEVDFHYLDPAVANAIQRLWSDERIRSAFQHRSSFQLNDTADYFFNELDRIRQADYLPTPQDVLMTRVATTGIQELQYTLRRITFNIVDMGGQRSERRKWLQYFDNVHAILFVGAISEYDQVIREDARTNRLKETIDVFDKISTSSYLKLADIILFLNKKDIFAEKIKKVPLTVCFSNYKGAGTYEDATKYVKKRFVQLGNRSEFDRSPKLYTHFTCATDTNQVQLVFQDAWNSLLSTVLAQTGAL